MSKMFFNGYTTELIHMGVSNQFRLTNLKLKRYIPSNSRKWYMNGRFAENHLFLITCSMLTKETQEQGVVYVHS